MGKFLRSFPTLNGRVTGAGVSDNVASADMTATGVAAGSYTLASITVDAAGRITAASAGSAGTVTSVSVVSANGFGGSVATSTTTPAITLTTSVTGLLKGNGTGVSAAVADTDYLTPGTAASTYSAVGHTHTFASLTSKPATLAGYGITDAAASGAVTASGLTMVTARLLGRTTAGTGAVEEITVGSGVSLSGGTLTATGTGGTVTSVSGVNANGLTVSVATGTTTPAITAGTSVTGILKGNGTAVSAAAAGTDYLAPAAIGVTVQAQSAELAAVALLSSAADRLPYFTGSGTAALATFTSFGRSLVDDADAATARGTLGAAASGAVTASGLTMTSARLLGRTTGATGAVEEITVGTGLSLSAGALTCTVVGGTGTVTSVGLSLPSIFSVSGTPVTTSGTLTATLAAQNQNYVFAGPTSGSTGTPAFRALVSADMPAFANGHLRLADTNASHNLILSCQSDLTADRTLSIVTGDINRTLTMTGNATVTGTNTGDQTITLTGDVTGSGTGSFAATIGAGTVTLAKMADVSTATVFYRKTAGTGAPEVQTLATLKTDLGLTGTNSGDQTITLTGNVTGTGTGSFATTIAAGAVTNAMLAGSIDLSTKVTGTLPRANAPPLVSAKAYYDSAASAGTDMAVANNSFVAVPLKTEAWDTNGIHDNATNPTRFTVPTGMGGKWFFTGLVYYPATAGGVRAAFLRKNGSTYFARGPDAVGSASADSPVTVTGVEDLAAGDYVELVAFQNSGGSITISRINTYAPSLTAYFLG